jgi:hypothetical protein
MWNGRNRMSSPVTMPPTWKLLSIMDRPMELSSCKMCSVIMYDTLWLFNIAMENGPFIDGLPINSMVISHGELLNNQMIMWMSSWSFHPCNLAYRIVPIAVPGKRNWMEQLDESLPLWVVCSFWPGGSHHSSVPDIGIHWPFSQC